MVIIQEIARGISEHHYPPKKLKNTERKRIYQYINHTKKSINPPNVDDQLHWK